MLSATEVKGAYFESMASSYEQRKQNLNRNLKHVALVYVSLLVNQLLTACLLDRTFVCFVISGFLGRRTYWMLSGNLSRNSFSFYWLILSY